MINVKSMTKYIKRKQVLEELLEWKLVNKKAWEILDLSER